MHSALMSVILTISVSQLNYVNLFNQMRRDANLAKMEKKITQQSRIGMNSRLSDLMIYGTDY